MEPGCTRDFGVNLGHSHCRLHAPCRTLRGDAPVWDPEGCEYCQDSFNLILARPGLPTEPNKKVLKAWVSGFQKNNKGPYLCKEVHRAVLFPRASPSVVVGVAPDFPSVGDLSLDDRMEAASDVSEDTERSLLEGTSRTDDQELEEVVVVPDVKAILSSRHGRSPTRMTPSQEGSTPSLSQVGPPPGFPPLGPHLKVVPPVSGVASTSAKVDTPAFRATPVGLSGPSGVNPSPSGYPAPGSNPAPVSDPAPVFDPNPPVQPSFSGAAVQGFPADLAGILNAFKTSLEQAFHKEVADFKEEAKKQYSVQATTYKCPLASELPRDHPELPWSHGLSVRLADGMYLLEKEKPRPESELQFCGDPVQFPNCWVRVAPWAPPRVDSVPKETVIFPFQKAQDRMVDLATKAGFSQTQLTLSSSNKAMFLASQDRVFPFASKVFSAVEKALQEDKPCPVLEEHKRTSMFLPNDSEAWNKVGETFSVGKLAPEVGAKQLQENLPYLFEEIMKAELEAKTRLSNSLSFQCVLESSLDSIPFKDDRENIFTCLAKQHSAVLKDDLYAFGMARRACRKHVLRNAKVRHEPSKLINSSIWGKDLFPDDVVKEVIAQATRESKTLVEKWDAIPPKRKAANQQGQGKKKKSRPNFFRQRQPQQQQQQQQQQQPQQQQFQGQPQHQPQVSGQRQSPAYNQKREDQGKSSYSNRRGRGRQPFRRGRGGSRGRGQRGNNKPSQR